MNDQPHKGIREAIDYALVRGWRLIKDGTTAHNRGRLLCPQHDRTGCQQAIPSSCNRVVTIIFHRDAPSLENAIRSAIANVQAAGCPVANVEIEADIEMLRAC